MQVNCQNTVGQNVARNVLISRIFSVYLSMHLRFIYYVYTSIYICIREYVFIIIFADERG